MKKIYILISILFGAMTAQAQPIKKQPKKEKIFGVAGLYNSYQSFDGLKQRIALRPEYQQLNNSIIGVHFGAEYETGGFVINGEIGLGSNFRYRRTGKATGSSMLTSGLKLGYNLTKDNNNIRIVPFAGFGIDFYGVSLRRDVTTIPFDSVLSNPILQESLDPVTLSNVYFNYKAGLMFDFALDKRKHHFMGIEAGYSASFGNSA